MADFDPLNAYAERYNDPGAPYFYKARVPAAGTPLRNALLGKALALNVRYPFFLVKGIGQQIGNMRRTPKVVGSSPSVFSHPNLNKPTLGTGGYGQKGTSQPPSLVDIRKSISIYLADELSNLTSTGQPYISLDFIPNKVNFDVGAKLVDLGIVGLNYPVYHYTGSQELISFEIDWYDYPQHRDRLITKCKKVEALSKADGFKSPPPEIIVSWQGSDMFKGKTFIVESASYEVKDFTMYRRVRGESTLRFNHLDPIQATQKLVLKRKEYHLTRNQIIYGTI